MFDLSSSLIALFAGVLLLSSVWAIHLRDEDASIVDPVWGPAIFLIGYVYAQAVGAPILGGQLVALLIAGAWAGRLAFHLAGRHSREGEDRRYRKMRESRGSEWWWRSYYVVFLLQAALAWVVALPLMAVLTGPVGLGWIGWAGAIVAIFGFFFEAIADGQLAAFKRREAAAAAVEGSEGSERGVMDQGLWGLSRHPNYFGESVVWWGIGLMAVSFGAYWALIGPAVITFMLLKVSGVSMTEAEISNRRPAYKEYVKRTNAFIPGSRR